MRDLALVTVLLLSAQSALADEFHFDGFRYGRRALGMGGAVTAYAGEPEASIYNPAGLAMLGGVQFSGSLHFFGVGERRVDGGLHAEGPARSRDLVDDSGVLTPSSSVISKSFREKRHVLAFSTFLASQINESFSGTTSAADDRGGFDEQRLTAEIERQDRVILRGLSYAWRADEALGLGVTLFWAEHDRQSRARRANVLDDLDSPHDAFADASSRQKTSAGSLFLRMGALWRASDRWRFGAACSTPSLRLYGEGELRVTLVSSGDPADPDARPIYLDQRDAALEVNSVLPANCRLGVAFVGSPRWLLTADLAGYLPIAYTRFELPPDLAGVAAAQQGIVAEVDAEPTANLAIGVEFRPVPAWALRAGAFSNHTSAPAIPTRPTALTPPHVDYYGVTASVGYLGGSTALALGAEYQFGNGEAVVPRDFQSLLADPEYLAVDRSDWRVVFFLSGAIGFASSSADALLK